MSITDRLPPKTKARKLLQARIDPKLYTLVRQKLEANQITVQAFFEAAIKEFLKET